MSPKRYVFDTYAVLALIEDEPGAQTVAEIITAQEPEIFMSIISLGEIYYILLRRKGEQVAEEVVKNTLAEESLVLVEATWTKVRDAARIKAKGRLSYADSFVLSLGKELDAPVVTGDPEILASAGGIGVEIIWIGK
ncbi:type II toxin-antitoxin system VapC family toxin [Pelotomaculum terephthalicicum JT]|uniref:type II toxin-antitoxin system VapC family toxin n=1 Tax=Pelotomaculum TaxID=191373 RepID=UPI0009C4DDC5|nr:MULTISPECIES: type II toxin-antitoxin system VapC family toxin [Pelotomaculum]MCG9968949.1 type II toxin-antitoxin system VapC family toxin [Pelotomaculum terephthalicicum JT]OPX86864.1 MAG: tRNA(fMet)-specific endonuclease VapC [Pelotomaculum sp. PtaB.Bin117]OPY60124.1 MAG: tRNA(fMet)-specific endonuclease VapC [Pelotomaculum sp. PtaU1.Bin065]